MSSGRMYSSATESPGLTRDKVRILLVEDSDDDAFFFQRTLRKSGEQCDYTHVGNGGEAVELLEEMAKEQGAANGGPIVMFLDLKMPVLSGFDVLAWIRQTGFPHPVHVVVLSGSDDPADRERARTLGAAEYVVKPISIQRLEAEIQNARRGLQNSKDPPRAE